MLNKKALISSMIVITLVLSVGCSGDIQQDGTNNDKEEIVQQENKEKEIMEQLDELKQKDVELDEIIGFINENIVYVSEENATGMVSLLEKIQKDYLPGFQEEFYCEDIQIKFIEAHEPNEDLKDINDKELKELMNDTKDKGYKVEMAEGSYFPIIDYTFYNKYGAYVTEDMKTYIEIMEVESTKVPAKDAALIIEWDEIIARALLQEEFINKHTNSIKINEVETLYSNYINFIFYGLDNTPLFNYDDKQMKDDAKETYLEITDKESKSGLIDSIKEFMHVLEENKYKLNEEVDTFRKGILDNLSTE